MLTLEQDAPFSSEAFLENCEGVLSPGDQHDLALAVEGRADESDSPFLRAWTARERQLRNAIVRSRAAARRVEPEAYLHPTDGFDVTTAQVAEEVIANEDPLRRERMLDLHRWHTIEELTGPASFDMDAVLAFALKLRMVERWAAMTEEAGRTNLEECLEALSRTD